jgi:hypothetical protein
MAVTRFPDTTDTQITEANWTGANKAVSGIRSWRQAGWDLSVNAGLNLDVDAGTAYVGGYYVDVSTTTTVALTDNATNRVWLQADGTIYDNTSDTPSAATDLFLGRVTTSGGSITQIEPNEELDTAAGHEVEGQRTSFCGIASLAASQGKVVCATLDLEPGLYWVFLRTSGSSASVLTNSGIELTCITASQSSAELAIIRRTESPGSNANGFWGNSGTSILFSNSGAAGQLTQFYTIHGTVQFADSGTIQVELETGANVSFNQGGYLIAKKIR